MVMTSRKQPIMNLFASVSTHVGTYLDEQTKNQFLMDEALNRKELDRYRYVKPVDKMSHRTRHRYFRKLGKGIFTQYVTKTQQIALLFEHV